jgi:hypothetical protein
MNRGEQAMLDILKKGRQEFNYIGIKAEFEAEGTRDDELLRLTEITRKAGLSLGIKIGGCEAITDLYRTKQIGVEYIIAPMVETSYAVSKYVEAKNKVYSPEEREDVRFLFNLETITSFNNLDEIIKSAKVENGADGIVFGRVDFTHSNGFSRNDIESSKITDYCIKTAIACKKSNMDLVVGGAITKSSLSNLKEVAKEYLTRFETRKIIFNSDAIFNPKVIEGMELAVKFEYLWLKNKFDHYDKIANEDLTRLKMLKERLAL